MNVKRTIRSLRFYVDYIVYYVFLLLSYLLSLLNRVIRDKAVGDTNDFSRNVIKSRET